jgi:hypothetical protein
MDPLGWANWTFGVKALLVPWRGHTLNPLFTPMHMPLRPLLEHALAADEPPATTCHMLAV